MTLFLNWQGPLAALLILIVVALACWYVITRDPRP